MGKNSNTGNATINTEPAKTKEQAAEAQAAKQEQLAAGQAAEESQRTLSQQQSAAHQNQKQLICPAMLIYPSVKGPTCCTTTCAWWQKDDDNLAGGICTTHSISKSLSEIAATLAQFHELLDEHMQAQLSARDSHIQAQSIHTQEMAILTPELRDLVIEIANEVGLSEATVRTVLYEAH